MAKKSVFNKPMREKKPAKKKEKPKPVSEPTYIAVDTSTPFKDAIDNLRQVVAFFRLSTGEQDIRRSQADQFLAELEAAINRVAAVFEP